MSEPQKPQYIKEKKPESGVAQVKDTIESILIAFILAFIFRAFVVEAFVIPTGSMAPTLLGANMRYHCDDCGWDFTVNYNGTNAGDDVIIPSSAGNVSFNIHCPNCGYKLPRMDNPELGQHGTHDTQVFYGDRILVLKYLYLFQRPSRWDVVVFKAPARPEEYHYQQNYIKRLIGTPGEQIVILDGDIYVRRNDSDSWVVQTKPYSTQKDLWRIIYDNDHHPRALPRLDAHAWEQPWKPDAEGWNLGTNETTGRVFRYSGADHAATLTFDANANPQQHAFTDWLAYDAMAQQQYVHGDPFNDERVFHGNSGGDNYVSDLKLDLYYSRLSGDGPLRLQLEKLDRTFIAELTPGNVKLLTRLESSAETTLGTAALPASDRPVHVEFTNVDYRVEVRVNGELLIQTTPQQYAPDFDMLMRAYEFAIQGTDDRPEAGTILGMRFDNTNVSGAVIDNVRPDSPAGLAGLREGDQVIGVGEKKVSSIGAAIDAIIRANPTAIRPVSLTVSTKAGERTLRLFGRYFPMPSARISADRQVCAIEHLSLWRDIYYGNRAFGSELIWAIPFRFPEHVMKLGKDEYFVLGDNSPISEDARYWGTRVELPDENLSVESGRVPGRFMLGKAFFVYWPAGYRVTKSSPAVIPNFGEMRFIH